MSIVEELKREYEEMYNDKWGRQIPNPQVAIWFLENTNPSDEIVLNKEVYNEIVDFRNEIVGEDDTLTSDIIWSNTVPIRDFIVVVDGHELRFCIFDNALEHIDEAPENETMLIGAIQGRGHNHFWLLGVTYGTNELTFSDEHFDMNGVGYKSTISEEQLSMLCKMWHGIQLMLLHPKLKEVFGDGKVVKQRKRTNDKKRKRVTYYIKRHVVNEERIRGQVREVNWHCKAWYVIGHWRTLKDGRKVYVRGYWKGELRALKRNLDDNRERKIV